MARAVNQKMKLLYIIRLLAETDESHAITMKEILEELQSNGIAAERKRIYDDLAALRDFGFPIVGCRGRNAGYYLEKREGAAALLALTAAVPEETEQIPEAGSDEAASKAAWLSGSEKVELACKKELAEELAAMTGGEVSVRSRTSKKGTVESISVKFCAQLCPEFYGWLAGFGCNVKLAAPSSAIREYRKYLKEIRNMYKDD